MQVGALTRTWRKISRRLLGPKWDTHRAFIREFRRARTEVVLAQYGVTGVLVREACRAIGVPLVVHFHGFDASHHGVLEAYKSGYESLFREAAAIVAVSKAMHSRLVALGANPDRVVYNPCGVDCDSFELAVPTSAPPIFLGVGRFVEKKGPHLTLVAFEQASRDYPDARLRLIGDGPLLGPCGDLARGLGIADRVEFLGARSHEEVKKEMRAARCFVQHSIEASDGNSEGTPVAILEAGAAGLPVIATRHAGISDVVVEEGTGLLVEERDVAGMAAHMRRILGDPELAGRLGRQGREHVRTNYTMDISINRLWQVIQKAAQFRRPSGS